VLGRDVRFYIWETESIDGTGKDLFLDILMT
jgi:hypothetical protein